MIYIDDNCKHRYARFKKTVPKDSVLYDKWSVRLEVESGVKP